MSVGDPLVEVGCLGPNGGGVAVPGADGGVAGQGEKSAAARLDDRVERKSDRPVAPRPPWKRVSPVDTVLSCGA
jgi:hypothetical protein